jgi:hypothetical protein
VRKTSVNLKARLWTFGGVYLRRQNMLGRHYAPNMGLKGQREGLSIPIGVWMVYMYIAELFTRRLSVSVGLEGGVAASARGRKWRMF